MSVTGKKVYAKWMFGLVFFLLATGIVAAGYAYYQSYKTHFHLEAESRLSAIASLKSDELVAWRRERLGDGGILADNSVISALVRRLLDNPDDAEAQSQLKLWMLKIQDQYTYVVVRLLDIHGRDLLSSSTEASQASSVVLRRIPEVLRSGKVDFIDFHRHDVDQRIYLDVLAPVFDPKGDRKPLGVFMLRVDPNNYLYPFINRWPMPSATAETLLVRRDGNDVLFLNELKFEKNSALSLRLPLTRTQTAAVKAVLGRTGLEEGVDYRGVAVLADTRAVPDSPWFLVTRMDTAEVFAPLQERLWATVLLVCALVFGAGTGVGYVWRQQRARFFRERLVAAEELRESQERLHRAVESAPFPMMIHAEDGEVEMISAAWTEITGYTEDDIPTIADWTEKAYGTRKQLVKDEINALYGLTQKIYEGDYSVRTKSGDVRIWDFMSAPLGRLPDGRRMVVSMAMDVTERRKADAILQESERFLRESQKAAGIGSYILDLPAGIWRSSGILDEIFGIDAATVHSLELWAFLVHPDDRQTMTDYFAVEVVQKQGRFNREYRIVRSRDGAVRWVHGLGELEFDDQHRPLRLVGTIQDITERKLVEQKLLHVMAAVESTGDAIGISDLQGRHYYQNKAYTELFGYATAAELQAVGGGAATVCDPAVGRELFETIIAGKTWSGELKLVTKSGRIFDAFERADAIKDERGQMIGLVGVVTDITERKRAEMTLQENERKFRTLFEHMTEGVALHEMIYDGEGQPVDYRILDVNPAFERHTGLAVAKTRGQLATVLYGVTPPPYFAEFERVARTGEAHRFETFFPGLDRYFHIGAISPKRGIFATVFEDITVRKRQERELQEKNTELERFTYTVSHDLKSPLITIKGFAGALLQDVAAGRHHRLAGDLRRVADAADKMGALLTDLLELSRIGRIAQPPAAVALDVLLRDVLRLLAGPIVQRHAEIVVQPGLPVVWADRQRLAEVWQNLIENALKFSGDQPQPRIEIGLRGPESARVFFVRDNGVGIDARYHETVFGLFNKLDARSEGTGIGLALVRRIIEVHGGRIWVESQGLGCGTTFCFTLPTTKSTPPINPS